MLREKAACVPSGKISPTARLERLIVVDAVVAVMMGLDVLRWIAGALGMMAGES